MPSNYVNDSKHWRERADEMRSLSLMMQQFDTASMVLKAAEDYDRLADRASGNAPVTRQMRAAVRPNPADGYVNASQNRAL